MVFWSRKPESITDQFCIKFYLRKLKYIPNNPIYTGKVIFNVTINYFDKFTKIFC